MGTAKNADQRGWRQNILRRCHDELVMWLWLPFSGGRVRGGSVLGAGLLLPRLPLVEVVLPLPLRAVRVGFPGHRIAAEYVWEGHSAGELASLSNQRDRKSRRGVPRYDLGSTYGQLLLFCRLAFTRPKSDVANTKSFFSKAINPMFTLNLLFFFFVWRSFVFAKSAQKPYLAGVKSQNGVTRSSLGTISGQFLECLQTSRRNSLLF